MRKLGDAKAVVGDAVGGALRIQDFQIEHAVHRYLNVVPGDANLRWNVDGLFFERMLVAHHVEEGHEDMKSRAKSPAVLAEALDHVGALLRDNDRGLGNDDDDQQCQRDNDDESTHDFLRFSSLPGAQRS